MREVVFWGGELSFCGRNHFSVNGVIFCERSPLSVRGVVFWGKELPP